MSFRRAQLETQRDILNGEIAALQEKLADIMFQLRTLNILTSVKKRGDSEEVYTHYRYHQTGDNDPDNPLIDKMAKAGWINREPDSGGWKEFYTITEQGLAVLAESEKP